MRKILIALTFTLFTVTCFARNTLQRQLDDLASDFAIAAKYIKVNKTNRTNAQMDTSIEALVPNGAGSLVNTIVVGTDGSVVMTLGALNFVHKSIRGMVVTLKPQYELSGTLTDFNLSTGDSKNYHIDKWVCTINNSTAGVDFGESSAYGKTHRYIRNTRLNSHADLENIFADACSDTTITLV